MPNIDQVQLPDGSQYNIKDNTSGYVTAGYVADVIDGLTKSDVGLGNVDNTSDLNKPVSTAQQTALNGKTDTTVIAPTEAITTASRRYEIGEQFILNGVLYTATAVIASGDSIIVNTNCELSENITEQIKEVNAKFDREYVEVSADGTKTRSQLFDALYALIDYSKINTATSILIIAGGDINTGSVYRFDYITTAYYRCSNSFITPTGYGGGGCELKPSGSTFASMSNGTVTNQSSQVLSSAYKIRLYY